MKIKLILLLAALSSVLTPKPANSQSGAIVVDIDNPKFRKLVVATPSFTVSPQSDKNLTNWGKKASEDLAKLLEFSGYFRIIDQLAYQGIKSAQGSKPAKSTIAGFEGYNFLEWKSIGVESLTVGSINRQEDGSYRIELRTADLNKGERLVGKAYTVKDLQDLDMVLKQYVDRVLTAYTGKPGIFSSKIAFIGRKSKNSEKQVYICDVDGKNLRQVTFTKSLHLAPSWSPDGSKLLFTSYESGNPDLYMLDLKTNKVEGLASYKGLNSGGVFSANGKLVAFSGSIRGNTEIYLKSLQKAGHRMPLLQGHGIDVDPAFSPDGKWLAFVSGRYGNPHIFRAQLAWNADKSQVKVVGDKRLTYAGWYNATPAWSPDSEKIAFAGFDRDIGRFDLFLMNHDGTKLERLTIKSGDNESPSWSPNGQLIMFHSNRIGSSNHKGPSQLYIMNRDGSHQRKISTGLYQAQTPRWGPFLLN
ncbi:MAG: PD40 domain-containing protein [Oligoflexales bacterium]|nr:PD40 domain-containing protein [Oligoflexales bacterium]